MPLNDFLELIKQSCLGIIWKCESFIVRHLSATNSMIDGRSGSPHWDDLGIRSNNNSSLDRNAPFLQLETNPRQPFRNINDNEFWSLRYHLLIDPTRQL